MAVNVVQFIRGKVADPKSRSIPWIRIQYPRSTTATYPLVSVNVTGGSRRSMSMGGTGDVYNDAYQIEIEMDADTNFTVATHTYAQYDAVMYIGDLIKNAIRDNRCLFTSTYSALDIWITPVRLFPYQEETDIYRGFMSLTVQFNDPKT